ncbi:MAG TPA: hypothetical protein VH413_00660 [Verrucomicrobiae bacterium]|nr:hypothetical protein [Verrucomicrobiae bacterium]
MNAQVAQPSELRRFWDNSGLPNFFDDHWALALAQFLTYYRSRSCELLDTLVEHGIIGAISSVQLRRSFKEILHHGRKGA